MDLPSTLDQALQRRGLRVTGALHPVAADGLAATVQTVLLLSPGPDFWAVFSASHEFQSSAPDPMDRWSRRVIDRLASHFDADAYYPFGGEGERAPFFAWAQRGGRAWSSPVKLLVGADMGLNMSYRGALGMRERVTLPAAPMPCASCAAPCTHACPIGALTADGYDVPACQSYLTANPDAPCRQSGCRVRRACHASSDQTDAQAQFHMAAFLA